MKAEKSSKKERNRQSITLFSPLHLLQIKSCLSVIITGPVELVSNDSLTLTPGADGKLQSKYFVLLNLKWEKFYSNML